MFLVSPWFLTLIILIGNCGFWLFCFNRINATSLHRKRIKKIEKLFVLLCFLIPTAIAVVEWNAISYWFSTEKQPLLPTAAPFFTAYGFWCLGSFIVLGIAWLESRFWLIPPKHLLSSTSTRYSVHDEIEGGSPGTAMTKLLHKLPGNEICHLTVTQKELLLARSVPQVDGLKIGHCSDLHFTGQLRLEHYHFVLDRLLEHEPDLLIVSGDIIDYSECLSFIDELFPKMNAPYGCSFVLGNHDRRILDLESLSSRVCQFGHVDLGRENQSISLENGGCLELVGNEIPWLRRHVDCQPEFVSQKGDSNESTLRICVSHSPDQIHWARKRNADLMLAGHTHGGQVRFPGIGPIVAPSYQGTRFASGTFFLPPTLMHVSRGVAGTHPLRWRCPPEVSLLTLRSG